MMPFCRPVARVAMAVALAIVCVRPAPAQNAAAEETPVKTVVLDTTGFWRMHHTLSPPVVRTSSGPKPLRVNIPWRDTRTDPAPQGWMQPDFDDSGWVRGPARRCCKAPYVERLCMRGKFTVIDPLRVHGLSLSVAYHGGAIVSLNGRELRRVHLGEGAELAEDYPRHAFVDSQGKLIGSEARRSWRLGGNKQMDANVQASIRTLTDLVIPTKLLREGVNVIGIELVRSAYDEAIEEQKGKLDRHDLHAWDIAWNTCEIRSVRLTADDATGLVPNAVRPKGLQVWNSNLQASDFDLDFGDRAEPVRTIRLVGVRNGAFSGKVVVGSDSPLRELTVTASALAGPGAASTIPAAAVRIRYGMPWGNDYLTYPHQGQIEPYSARPSLIGALLERPPADVPVREKATDRYCTMLAGQPVPVFGAVTPIWVTVSVPGTAAPGRYGGRITIRAQGHAPVVVPVQMDLIDWSLPTLEARRMWVEMVQSPGTLAMEYDVAPWSDRHFDLIARSMRYLNEIGSRVVYVPLIAYSHYGNEQSMVRWVRRGEDRAGYDFSIMDRYLDVAQKHMGTPKIVVFYVWDVYMMPTEEDQLGHGDRRVFAHLQKNDALMGVGPAVTFVDPGTRALESYYLPRYGEPGTRALWQPLFTQLRERMRERGLEQTMMLGMLPDQWATKEEITFLKEVSGDLPWVVQSHMGAHECNIYDIATAGYQSRVWAVHAAYDPEKPPLYGWKRPELLAKFIRAQDFDAYSHAVWRTYPEFTITGDQRGAARIGGDFWPVVRDKTGRRVGTLTQRYPQSSWRNLDPWAALLAPGPNGAVATTRFEVFREGLQEAEARIFIEQALTDSALRARLGLELAGRCEDALKERLRRMWRGTRTLLLNPKYKQLSTHVSGIVGNTWFIGSGWQEQSRILYTLAAEVAQKCVRARDPDMARAGAVDGRRARKD